MAQAGRRSAREKAGPQPTLTTRFIRGNSLRVIHVDGAWGGIAPQGHIHLGLFSEYVEPPTAVTYAAGPNKRPQEVKRAGGGTVLRELEVIAILTPEVARSLRDWLNVRLTEVEKINEQLGRNQP